MNPASVGAHPPGVVVFSLGCARLVLVLATFTFRALGDDMGDDAAPDKSGYTLLDPTPDAELRDFNTDRPPKANSPYTVDAGHFQYETDLAVLSYSATNGGRTDDWTVVDPTLKIGLTNAIDAELQVTPYESLSTDIAGNATTISGLGDTYARLKINVLGDDRGAVAVALLPYVKLPTAQSGLGNGKVEGGLILPVSFSAPGGFTVIVMPEGDYLKDNADNGYHGAFDFLINVSHALDKRWTFYSEVFTTQSFKAGDRPIYTADAALSCALRSNLQLDFGGNFSLNDVGPQTQLYVGLSQRF
jgi:Putative MetA-pathway of phenol degradation